MLLYRSAAVHLTPSPIAFSHETDGPYGLPSNLSFLRCCLGCGTTFFNNLWVSPRLCTYSSINPSFRIRGIIVVCVLHLYCYYCTGRRRAGDVRRAVALLSGTGSRPETQRNGGIDDRIWREGLRGPPAAEEGLNCENDGAVCGHGDALADCGVGSLGE